MRRTDFWNCSKYSCAFFFASCSPLRIVMTAPKTSDGAKPACVPFVAILGCCDRAQSEKPGSSKRNGCWQSYFRAILDGRGTSAHELALDVVRDQLLRRNNQIYRGRSLSTHKEQRRGEEQIEKENERGERPRVQAGGLAGKSRRRQSRCFCWMTAPGKIMESALLSGEVAWGFPRGLIWRGNSFAGCLRVFPFPGPKLYDTMYLA